MRPLEQKLLNLLSNRNVTFYIPPYQRNYEWTEEQCRVFWEDVKKTCEKNRQGENSEHFFGSITYFQNEVVFGQPNKLVLIDGQQRITTTMLFLAALRDTLADESKKEWINNDYLINEKVKDGDDSKIKLKQVEADWDSYKEIIFKTEEGVRTKDSAVYKNYNFFRHEIAKYTENGDSLIELLNLGLVKFSVITIELEPDRNKWENPQEIFESMNSLGKPLSLADLVRNYLMLGMKAKDQDQYYHDCWLPIEREIPGLVSLYIRDFMQFRNAMYVKGVKESNYKELYGIFKDIFADTDKKELLKGLAVNAKTYAVVHGKRSSGNPTVDHILKDLRDFRVSTAYSFLLGLLSAWEQNKFDQQGIIDILKAFRIYCLRRRLLDTSQAENKNFPTLLRYINKLAEAPNKQAALFEILSKQQYNLRIPNDTEITKKLETENFYRSQYWKLYLALIEEHLTKSRPDMKDSLLQVEHIMPQTLNDQWRAELGSDVEQHQELVHTIGNLTLIRHNQELGNKSFAEKKDIYENHSGLQITKTKIIENEHWNAETIKDRTDWLTNLLLNEILPIPEEMRKMNNFTTGTNENRNFSFRKCEIPGSDCGLIGKEISFIADKSFVALVVDDKNVQFEGEKKKLSTLTRELFQRLGRANQSGAYQGAQYWEYNGTKLAKLFWKG